MTVNDEGNGEDCFLGAGPVESDEKSSCEPGKGERSRKIGYGMRVRDRNRLQQKRMNGETFPWRPKMMMRKGRRLTMGPFCRIMTVWTKNFEDDADREDKQGGMCSC